MKSLICNTIILFFLKEIVTLIKSNKFLINVWLFNYQDISNENRNDKYNLSPNSLSKGSLRMSSIKSSLLQNKIVLNKNSPSHPQINKKTKIKISWKL